MWYKVWEVEWEERTLSLPNPCLIRPRRLSANSRVGIFFYLWFLNPGYRDFLLRSSLVQISKSSRGADGRSSHFKWILGLCKPLLNLEPHLLSCLQHPILQNPLEKVSMHLNMARSWKEWRLFQGTRCAIREMRHGTSTFYREDLRKWHDFHPAHRRPFGPKSTCQLWHADTDNTVFLESTLVSRFQHELAIPQSKSAKVK